MLPQGFMDRMRGLLGDGFADFERALGEPNVRALRVNTLKTDTETYMRLAGGRLDPIPYARDGFIPEAAEGIGNTPEHHAGMIYVQDPGAMAPINAVDIPEGAYVLDTCAAPGGKSSQLAARIGPSGFLLANEYVPKRAKIIVGNFERLGITNAVVTSLDTRELGEMFREEFDILLCDAPCSGEGMFRKCDEAIVDWSEENVSACAERQLAILENTVGTLKVGGKLIYSTCTYSTEENEEVVLRFTKRHPEMRLCPVKEELICETAEGIPIEGCEQLKLCRRFYPHISRGEGQFVAVMEKTGKSKDLETILYKSTEIKPNKNELALVNDFIKTNMNSLPDGRFIRQGEGISHISFDVPLPERRVFMAGVMLGEIRGKLFFPHHQLFSAYGHLMKRQLNLKCGDPCVEKYLRGEEIDAAECPDGWCAVLYEGAALGGGKVSRGRLKNHYPKGLRIK